MTKINKNLTEGSIKKQLFTLTWSMLFGMMGIVIFNLVDTYFVGMLGTKELAAIGFCFPVIMFINSLSQGIGIGIGTGSRIEMFVLMVVASLGSVLIHSKRKHRHCCIHILIQNGACHLKKHTASLIIHKCFMIF